MTERELQEPGWRGQRGGLAHQIGVGQIPRTAGHPCQKESAAAFDDRVVVFPELAGTRPFKETAYQGAACCPMS